jgi:UPF0716 family protein affecting phage T7 exclusion
MALTSTRRRRTVGLVFLMICIVLVIAGQTVFRANLTGILFIGYWLGCLVFLGLAVATALLDLLLVRHQARKEQLDLLQQTLRTSPPARPADQPGKSTRLPPTTPTTLQG